MKDVVILGAAYFSREVYSMVQDCIADGVKWRFKGFLDDRPKILDDFPHSGEILGSVENYIPKENDLIIPALGNPLIREKYVTIVKGNGCKFGTLIHPSAQIGANVEIGTGCVVMQNVVMTAGLVVGDFVNVGVQTILSHGNRIGPFSQFANLCSITGEVRIGRSVECGCGVTVIPHVTVGDYAQLCSGSVVLKDVKPYEKVIGNPARPIGYTQAKR